jgi:hypothetical protein
MENAELLRLAYVKIAEAERLLELAGEVLIAAEAEGLADKIDRAEVSRSTPTRPVR